MSILRKMFNKDIPNPVKAVVTRWDQDPFAYGSYSSVGVNGTGQDYDVLAESLAPAVDGDEATSGEVYDGVGNAPRVFFGGEHTVRNYPATVHGAFLSGLREAGKIAAAFLGEPYKKKRTNEVPVVPVAQETRTNESPMVPVAQEKGTDECPVVPVAQETRTNDEGPVVSVAQEKGTDECPMVPVAQE
jgi:hypothetical protein